MLWSPRKPIIALPFIPEYLAITGTCPELRLLQENGGNACIDHLLHYPAFHVVDKSSFRHYVRDIVSMPDRISVPHYLANTEMVLSIPFAQEIIIVRAPCNTCHELYGISMISPRFHPLFKGHIMPVTSAVYNGDIRSYIYFRPPWTAGLKGCFFSFLRTCKQGDAKAGNEEQWFLHNGKLRPVIE